MLAARVRLLIVTLWAGSLWTVGYLAAPTLFETVPDRALAGTIAGALFRSEAWLSLSCGVAFLALMKIRPDGSSIRMPQLLALAMMACTLVGYFGLQPWMAELRQSGDGLKDPAVRVRFAVLHGVSSGFYLMQSVLAVLLVLKTHQSASASER